MKPKDPHLFALATSTICLALLTQAADITWDTAATVGIQRDGGTCVAQ